MQLKDIKYKYLRRNYKNYKIILIIFKKIETLEGRNILKKNDETAVSCMPASIFQSSFT